MKNLHLDFETSCNLDLKKVGLHRYIEDKSFQPLCVAWKLDAGGAIVTRLDDSSALPRELDDLLLDPNVQAHAWNAAFEDRILRAHYAALPARPLSCTMQRALAYGLPGRLEKAGLALGTHWLKDMACHRLMLKMSRAPGAAWSDTEWAALLGYCSQDVLVEAEIAGLIPELSAAEQALAEVDRSMNNRGIWVNTDTVKLLAGAASEAEKAEAARASAISGGAVTSPGTQVARLLAWLGEQNVSMPDLARATVEEALNAAWAANIPPQAVEMLGIRLRMARASTRKLTRMLEMTSAGSRLRGQFQFLGAGRTGRWAGRGVQVQNLPRVPKEFSPPAFIAMAGVAAADPWLLESALDAVAPAPVLDCVSWSLRACLEAGPGHQMWSFDFAQIEARVLAWLAGQQDVLNVFRSGDDVYVWAAAQFGSENRQLGKVLILALGFGMGATKLRETARELYGVSMSAGEAEAFKDAWRQRNHHIVRFWRIIEAAAQQAILRPGQVFHALPSTISLAASRKTLKMQLPSGRLLYYHKPHIQDDRTITYWGEEKGQWIQRRTWGGTLAENATQACARDIMAEAMMRVAARGGSAPLMTVHDELVYGRGSAAEDRARESLLRQAPSWAGGLPLDGEVKVMSRYGVVALK